MDIKKEIVDHLKIGKPFVIHCSTNHDIRIVCRTINELGLCWNGGRLVEKDDYIMFDKNEIYIAFLRPKSIGLMTSFTKDFIDRERCYTVIEFVDFDIGL